MYWPWRRQQADQPPGVQGAQGGQAMPLADRLRALREVQRRSIANGGTSSWWQAGVGQAPVEATPTGVIERGPCDNQAIFGALGAIGVVLMPSLLGNIDVAPFGAQDVADFRLTLDWLVTASYICTLRIGQPEGRRQQLILEMMVPYLPADQIIPMIQARDEAYQLLNNNVLLAEQNWFVEGLQELGRGGAYPNIMARWVAGNWAADAAPVPAQQGQPLNAQERRDGLQARLDTLWHIARVMGERQRGRAMYPVLLILVSFAFRGEVTQAKLHRIQQELAVVMPGAEEQLNRADIALTWRNFGHLVNDTNISEVMQRWIVFIPAAAIRLRVILAQATRSGLTSLDVIAKAIYEHPHFPWYKIQRLFTGEWARAVNALRVVGSNPYFAYRKDLGEVRASLYKPISWVAGRILIVGGDKTLGEYRGFQPDARYRDLVENLISEYYQSGAGPAQVFNHGGPPPPPPPGAGPPAMVAHGQGGAAGGHQADPGAGPL